MTIAPESDMKRERIWVKQEGCNNLLDSNKNNLKLNNYKYNHTVKEPGRHELIEN